MEVRLGRKLGARTLRFGDRGPDVKQLHAFLRLQGYDLGEEEHYGYLTKDAVRQFQRDHGLVADGIAGKRFFALVLKEDLPIRRRVHLVQPQETLEEIAAKYGLGTEAFRLRRGAGVYPGQRLVFFDREVWGICRNGLKPGLPQDALTGVICSSAEAAPKELPSMIRPAEEAGWDVLAMHSSLKSPRRRRKTAQRLSAALADAPGSCGLYVPWREVAQLDGVRYVKLLRLLRRVLTDKDMLWVELGPGVPPWKIWGGVDYRKVTDLVDRVVLQVPQPDAPGPLLARQPLQECLQSLLRYVHSWKILLHIPVYALEWEFGPEGIQGTPISYQTALSKAYRRGARLRQGEQGEYFYQYHSRGVQYEIHIPHHSALGDTFSLANRYNLAGVILDWLGMEDPRIWQALRAHFRTASLNISGQ